MFKPYKKTLHKNVSYVNKVNDNKMLTTTWILNMTDEEVSMLINDLNESNLICDPYQQNHLKVIGTAKALSTYLNTELHYFKDNSTDNTYFSPTNNIILPDNFKDKIIDILGLNDFHVAQPYFKLNNIDRQSRAVPYFTPLQLASTYNFPPNLNGNNKKVGIIELGGGYVFSDITTYLTSLGITTTPNITSVSVNGGVNNPSDTSGANFEVVLDIEIIVALVPNALIRVYFAPNSEVGFYDAIQRAINDGCSVISISWGATEGLWRSSTLTAYNNLFQTAYNQNIIICAASGDNGSSDGRPGNNVNFPASSPFILGCGGTRLTANGTYTGIALETVWNNNSINSATGGGISKVFNMPSYQSTIGYNLNNKRGVPDICGDADPNTGYLIYMNNTYYIIGGTSAVSPLWSGLLIKVIQSMNSNISNIHQRLYTTGNVLRDITSGNNGSFVAQIGWDACTGNGSPNGISVLNLLSAPLPTSPIAAFTSSSTSIPVQSTLNFTDQSTNSPIKWLWKFGDGTISTQKNPSHIYTKTGVYTVILSVGNSSGSNTLTKTNYITITASPNAPIVSFTATPLRGSRPLRVTFNNTTTKNPTSFMWQFGDSNTSTLKNPVHTYNRSGTYTVTLMASNNYGSNKIVKTNYIRVI